MKGWKVAVIALVMTSIFGGLGYWVTHRQPKAAAPAKAAAPQNDTHERAFLEEQLKSNPGHAPVLLRLAEMERKDGNLKAARARLEEGVAADPNATDVRLELSRLYYETGDTEASRKQVEAILKIDPNNVDALYNLGAIHANAGHIEEARKYWTQAKSVAPQSQSGKKAAQGLTQIGL